MSGAEIRNFDFERADWMKQAACRGMDTDRIFYPKRGASAAEALRICNGCQVRAECLAWARETGTDDGIYGGMTPNQRRGPTASRRCEWCRTVFTAFRNGHPPRRFCGADCRGAATAQARKERVRP